MHAKSSIGGILAWLALTMPLVAQAPADRASLVGTSWRLVKFEHLPLVRSYVLKDGHLFLSLMADGGIYEYEPMPPAAK